VTLLLEWEKIGGDYSARLTGGRAHVGAVGVGNFDSISGRASSSVITTQGHREDELALLGARKLSESSHSTTVFIVGIHADNINKEEIKEIVSVSKEMINELSGILQED
jgi:hypothetical protein